MTVHFLLGKFIFASLIATFRHGREEDEVMGISFKKELVVDRVQVYPADRKDEETKLQVIYLNPKKDRHFQQLARRGRGVLCACRETMIVEVVDFHPTSTISILYEICDV